MKIEQKSTQRRNTDPEAEAQTCARQLRLSGFHFRGIAVPGEPQLISTVAFLSCILFLAPHWASAGLTCTATCITCPATIACTGGGATVDKATYSVDVAGTATFPDSFAFYWSVYDVDTIDDDELIHETAQVPTPNPALPNFKDTIDFVLSCNSDCEVTGVDEGSGEISPEVHFLVETGFGVNKCSTRVGVTCDVSMAITLVSFTATFDPIQAAVLIQWATESEINNEGFNLLRSIGSLGNLEVLNTHLIPAQGGPGFGATYEIVDNAMKPDATYYYILEDIDTAGTITLRGANTCLYDPFDSTSKCEPLAITIPNPSEWIGTKLVDDSEPRRE